mmetsp:Transcript_16480/g.27615  ORF Transcript_16480/g.27615 Transcript_16480/m.27615 type:complete len:456 (-) Transcript_16480:2871-4238(-)
MRLHRARWRGLRHRAQDGHQHGDWVGQCGHHEGQDRGEDVGVRGARAARREDHHHHLPRRRLGHLLRAGVRAQRVLQLQGPAAHLSVHHHRRHPRRPASGAAGDHGLGCRQDGPRIRLGGDLFTGSAGHLLDDHSVLGQDRHPHHCAYLHPRRVGVDLRLLHQAGRGSVRRTGLESGQEGRPHRPIGHPALRARFRPQRPEDPQRVHQDSLRGVQPHLQARGLRVQTSQDGQNHHCQGPAQQGGGHGGRWQGRRCRPVEGEGRREASEHHQVCGHGFLQGGLQDAGRGGEDQRRAVELLRHPAHARPSAPRHCADGEESRQRGHRGEDDHRRPLEHRQGDVSLDWHGGQYSSWRGNARSHTGPQRADPQGQWVRTGAAQGQARGGVGAEKHIPPGDWNDGRRCQRCACLVCRPVRYCRGRRHRRREERGRNHPHVSGSVGNLCGRGGVTPHLQEA